MQIEFRHFFSARNFNWIKVFDQLREAYQPLYWTAHSYLCIDIDYWLLRPLCIKYEYNAILVAQISSLIVRSLYNYLLAYIP